MPRLISCFVMLTNVSDEMGATDLWPGTHTMFHFNNKYVAGAPPFRMALPEGSIVLWDSRLLHRGSANTSPHRRPAFYFSFMESRGVEPHGPTYSLLRRYRSEITLEEALALSRRLRKHHNRSQVHVPSTPDAAVLQTVEVFGSGFMQMALAERQITPEAKAWYRIHDKATHAKLESGPAVVHACEEVLELLAGPSVPRLEHWGLALLRNRVSALELNKLTAFAHDRVVAARDVPIIQRILREVNVLGKSGVAAIQCEEQDVPSGDIHSFPEDYALVVEICLRQSAEHVARYTTWLGSHTHVHVTGQIPAQHASLALPLKLGDVLVSSPRLLRRWLDPQLPIPSLLRCFIYKN